jgi:PKD repeat protein
MKGKKMKKIITISMLVWLSMLSVALSDISIQYINSPANTIPENASGGTPLAYIFPASSAPFSMTDNNFYIDRYYIEGLLQYRLNASDTFAIDYESAQPGHTYTLTVTYNTGYSNIALAIGDVNESPLIKPQTFDLIENTANGTSVYQVDASDPDIYTGFNNLSYSIVGGNGSNALSINASTGMITVKNKTYLDYETNRDLYLTVSVSDGKHDDIATISVNLININDNPPVISDQAFTLGKDVPVNTLVSKVYASDPDGNTLSYAITNGNTNNAFTIDPSTGIIRVNNSGQILNDGPGYFLTVSVSDSGYTKTAQIRVDINNLNYAPLIEPIADHAGTVNTARQIVFHVEDSNGEQLVISATSGSQLIVPNGNIQIDAHASPYQFYVLEGSQDLTLTILPLNRTGTTQISINVSDGAESASTSFDFEVMPNSAPIICDIPFQAFDINAGAFTKSFTVSDSIGETFTLSVLSDNQAVVPNAQIIIDNNGQNATYIAEDSPRVVTLNITPLITGSANIQLSAIDTGGLQDIETFELRVSTLPDISNIANVTISEDVLSNAISFTTLTQEPGNLTIAVIPDNLNLIPADAAHMTICHNSVCLAGNTQSIDPAQNNQETIQLFILSKQDQYGQLGMTVCVTNEYGLTNTTHFTTTITAKNDAPVIVSLGEPGTYTEQGMPAQIMLSPVIQDVDTTYLENARIVISQNYHSGDILNFEASAKISGLFMPETRTLQLTGIDSIAAYQTALQSVTYSNTSDNPNPLPRTFSITVNDGKTDSAVFTHTLTITAINDPPTLTATTRSVTATESLSTIIAKDILVSDPDNNNLVNAQIQIVQGFQWAEDQLLFTETQSITASYQTATGMLSLSGIATVADYQTALQSIKYNNTSDNPNTYTRLIRIEISDSLSQSNAITQTLFVAPLNDAPTISGAGATIAYVENDPAINIVSDIVIADVDNDMISSAIVYITGYQKGADLLIKSTPGGSSTWNNDSGILSIYGKRDLIFYQAALNGVKYQNISDNPTSTNRTIAFMVEDDHDGSNVVKQIITVQPINDPPILTADAIIVPYTENAIISMTQSLTITDYDNANLQQAIIRIINGYNAMEDRLGFTSVGNIADTWNAESATITLTGNATIASWEQALDQVVYQNMSEKPSTQDRSVTFTIFDGTAWSAPVTRTVQIISVNDPPILSFLSIDNAASFTEKAAAVSIAQSFSIVDHDTDTITQLTVRIASGYTDTQDVLNVRSDPHIQKAWNNGILTLTGARPISEYVDLVQTLTYENISIAPDPLIKPIVYQAWDISDASLPVTQTMTITPINDPPVLTGGGTTISITENHLGPILENFVIDDPDSKLIPWAKVTITDGYHPYEDVLVFEDYGMINGEWHQDGGYLQIVGKYGLASPGAFQNFINTVQYKNSSDNPSIALRTIEVVVFDGSFESNALTGTIQNIPINDTPVVSNSYSYTFTENIPMPFKNALLIEDPDSPNFQSATVTIQNNYVSDEDFLSFVPFGNITGAYMNGTLTLTGEDTKGNYVTALSRVFYENPSDNPTLDVRSVTVSVNDGSSESQPITHTIAIDPVNDPPTIILAHPLIKYTEDSGLSILDPGIVISDPDSVMLNKAVIQIIDDTYMENEDFLSYTTTGNIQVNWKPVTGEFVLSGLASLNEYQTALAGIAYSNNSNDPSAHDRIIKWTVSDPIAKSLSATQNMQIIPVNDLPVITGSTGILQYQENNILVIDNGIQIMDFDNTTLASATIMISEGFSTGAEGEDLLIYPEKIGNISSAGMSKDTGVLNLTGIDTINNYIAALRTIQYYNLKDDPKVHDRHITFSVNDGMGTQSSFPSERVIQLFSTNDPPILKVNTGGFVKEGSTLILSKAYLSATDPDDPDEGLFYTISDLPEYGTLTIDAIPLASGLTLIQGDIDTGRIKYTHDGGESFNDDFSFYVTDMHGAVAPSQSFVISITPVNDAPIITSTPGITATEDILYAYTITVSDPDDTINGTDISFELQNAPQGMSVSSMGIVHWIPTEGVLTSGMVTLVVHDGEEDNTLPPTQSFTITVMPVEDPPELSAIEDLLTYGNTKAGPIPFTVFDAEGGPLTLNVFANNEELVQSERVLFQDQTPYQLNLIMESMVPQEYFLTIMPSLDEYGSLTTTIMATDATGLTATETFVLLVDKVTITVDHWTHGSITPGNPAKVKKGEYIHFRIQASVGYIIRDVYIDGQAIGPVSTYTFWNVIEPHSITATFSESTVYTITTVNTNGGTIDPKGIIPMTAGDTPVFHIIPEKNYAIDDIRVDDISMGPLEWYTFPPLDAVHEIKPLFRYMPPPNAMFSFDKTQGKLPLTVQFLDQSKGEISQWLWEFGDGNQSAAKNPKHTYMKAGTYHVTLTVSGTGGSTLNKKENAIVVEPSEVDFSVLSQTGPAPFTVTFINQTTLAQVNAWQWNFGDSQTSTLKNPVHMYEMPGRYTVKLTARVDEENPSIEKNAFIHVTGRKITGTVSDELTKLGISNMTVALWQDDHLFMETQTNSSGAYTLGNLPVSDGWVVSIWPDDLTQYRPIYFDGQLSHANADRQSTREGDLDNINFIVTAAPSYGIKGKVHDGRNQALPDIIQVSLYSEKFNIARTVMTDAEGAYLFTGLPESDDYRISAWSETCGCDYYYFMEPHQIIGGEHPYYSTRTYQASTRVPSSIPPTPFIDLIFDYGGTISGTVKDNTGNPLSNVWVNAWSDLFDMGNGAFTDTNGDYQIKCLRAGSIPGTITYRVEVNPKDYPALIYNQAKQPQDAKMVPVESQDIDFIFQKGLSIGGKVVDENGYALSGIPVHAWSESFDLTAYGQTITDNAGKYTIANLPHQPDYRVAVYPLYYPIQYYPASHTLENAAFVDLQKQNRTNIDFHLIAGATIRGIVYNQKEGTPAPMGLIVNIWSDSTQTGGEIAIDANGRFEMTGLRSGICDYIISINQPPFIPAYYAESESLDWEHSWENTTPVCPSESNVRKIILIPGYDYKGRIIFNNDAVAGALIQAWSSGSGIWAETNSTSASEATEHNFILSGLAAGTYEIKVLADGFENKVLKNIGINDNVDNVIIELKRPENQITGTVYGLETDKKIQISAWAQSIQAGDMIHLQGDGNPVKYTLTALKPAPDYRVELWSMDYPYQVYPGGSQFNDAQDISVNGTTRNIDFNLKAEETGTISGIITPWPEIEDGEVVFVDAISQSLGAAKNARLVFDSNDPVSYLLKGLPFGADYIVSVWSNASPMMFYTQTYQTDHAIQINVPASNINFSLNQGMQISGNLYQWDNQPISGALVSSESETMQVYRSSRTAKDGSYVIKGLPPADDYIISASVADMPAIYYQTLDQSTVNLKFSKPVDIRESYASSINLHLPSGESICGFVVDPDGRAIQFAWISAISEITGAENETFSDIHGNFCIKGLPEAIDYQLTIRPALPYVDTIRNMIATQTSNLKCIVEKGFEIWGQVLDQIGSPVSNTEISLWSSSRNYHTQTKSNSSGNYSIAGVPQTTDMFITAMPPKNKAVSQLTDGPFAVNQALEKNIILGPAITIKGQILSKETGNPIPDAIIIAYSDAMQTDAWAESASNGSFSFNHLPEADDYLLTIRHKDFATQTVPFVSAIQDLQIFLQNGGIITGQVQDEYGTYLPDVRISIQSDNNSIMDTVSSDNSGRFAINGLPLNGHLYNLSAEKEGFAPEIKSAQAVGAYVSFLMVSDSASIQGRITDSQQQLPPDTTTIIVRLFDSNENFVQKVTMAPNGEFVFKGVNTQSDYIIKCSVSEGLIDRMQWIGAQGKGVLQSAEAALFKAGDRVDVNLIGSWDSQ